MKTPGWAAGEHAQARLTNISMRLWADDMKLIRVFPRPQCETNMAPVEEYVHRTTTTTLTCGHLCGSCGSGLCSRWWACPGLRALRVLVSAPSRRRRWRCIWRRRSVWTPPCLTAAHSLYSKLGWVSAPGVWDSLNQSECCLPGRCCAPLRWCFLSHRHERFTDRKSIWLLINEKTWCIFSELTFGIDVVIQTWKPEEEDRRQTRSETNSQFINNNNNNKSYSKAFW